MTRRRVGRPTNGGDLRGELVEATLRLLGESGDPGKVTVAAIVDAVGCTPPTLYNYWPKRELLLLEASEMGFVAFRESQAEAAARESDPLARIRLRGDAYLAFALARPSLFRVLFLDRPVPGAPRADAESPGAGLDDLIHDVELAMRSGQLAAGEPQLVAAGLWAGVHGIAALFVNTPELPQALAWAVAAGQTEALLKGYSAAPSD
jgi:AcrR family transcriptional regulator